MWHPHPEAVTHWLRTIALGGIILLKEICHWWWAWRRCSLSPLPALSASCVWIRCDLWATVAAAAVKLLCHHRLSLRNQMTSFFSKLIMVTVVYHPTKKKKWLVCSPRGNSVESCVFYTVFGCSWHGAKDLTEVLGMLGKHSINWVTSPAFGQKFCQN